jgi:hypothetical protein
MMTKESEQVTQQSQPRAKPHNRRLRPPFAEWAISTFQQLVRPLRAGTIRTRLPLAFVLMVLLPAVVIITTSVLVSLQGGRQQVFNQLESVATLKEAEIKTWLESLQLELSFEVGRDVAEQRMSALLQSQPGGADFQTIYDEQMTRFQQAIELKSKFEELFLMNRQGQVVLSTDVEQKDKIYSNQTQ